MRLEALLKGRWIKYPEPVLRPGESGEWDDLMADCPGVFSNGGGKFYISYTGHSTSRHLWGIGLSESEDLFNWKKYGNNPVILSGGAGAWDQRMDGPTVIRRDGVYYLFYEAASSFSFSHSRFSHLIPYGVRKRIGAVRRRIRSLRSVPASQAIEHARGRKIGFAASTDMVNWVKHPGNPVLCPSGSGWDSEGVLSPTLISAGGLFYMFYGGSDGERISSGYAVSKDLLDWKKKGAPVLKPGPAGSWDDSSVLAVSIVTLEDAYVIFYEGQDSMNVYSIGFAHSRDLNVWTKFDGNPVIRRGAEGSIDERVVNSPHAIVKDDGLFVFFGALDREMRGRSRVAFLDRRRSGRPAAS